MDTLKLRKEVSKPVLLQAVRGVFDPVVDPVAGRQLFHRSMSDVGTIGGVSGEARLAVAV